MKAFLIDRYGSNDVVRAGEMPDPELQDNDVLVQIHAASVNPVDLRTRDGKLKLILPYRLPFALGNDLAGVVVRVGSGVRRFKPGDEVYARPDKDRVGTFAEFISMKEDAVAQKPKRLTMEEAASIPMVGLTAWQVLVEKANLKKGQKVLIHAGSGGVGTFAIQLARHLGALVATTTSTANLDWVKRLGADTVIDYRKEDFETILHDFDVVLDTQGGETLEKSLRVLKPGGKLLGFGFAPSPRTVCL
jgi:NADPH:quinone reductase-like Zn-dependent oxidoreductase